MPLPANGQLFSATQAWVESGTALASITFESADASASQRSRSYPAKPIYGGMEGMTAATR